jgi:hypothetical protein
MNEHSDTHPEDRVNPHPWETGEHVAKTMYRLESTDRAVIYVVADGFDDAVRKVHHHYWKHGWWPVMVTDPVSETPCYDRISKVELFHQVIL